MLNLYCVEQILIFECIFVLINLCYWIILDVHEQKKLLGTVKSQKANKLSADPVDWVALLKPIHTKNNYKDNYNSNYGSLHTNER